mgnify:CR=1 FL=1
MSSELYIPKLPKIAGETRAYVFDFTDCAELEAGETISTPSVAAVSGLTIGTPAVLAAAVDDVAAGKGVQVAISGGTAGTTYTLNCTVNTSGGAVLIRRAHLRVY